MTRRIFDKADGQPVCEYRYKAGDQLPCSTVELSQKKRPTSREKRRVYYDDLVPGAYLTAQETRCIQALLKHPTYANAANTLSISARTVESHMINIRRKFRCRNKRDVMRLFQSKGMKA